MDEASGNYFGKVLLQDYFYNKMPEVLKDEFSKKFNLDPGFIKDNLYQKENPNMYLASFAKFMGEYKTEPYIKELIRKGFNLFIENKIKTVENYKNLPIHFVGSIAYYFQDILKETLKENNLIIGKIIQKPIDNLIKYHSNLTNKL